MRCGRRKMCVSRVPVRNSCWQSCDPAGQKFFFASFLFQHNFKVGLLAMATGVLASVPTVFLMVFNGMLLGVFVAIHYQAGIRAEMWAWILPHGVTEIGAIMLCGGVGLMLGQAVVQPGLRSRKQQLISAGREASQVIIGIGGMLVAAAVIESYVRQSHWSTEVRLLFAAATAVFWLLYFVHGAILERRSQRADDGDDRHADDLVGLLAEPSTDLLKAGSAAAGPQTG